MTPNTYWIIFDTSQYAEYYADVHNLLALPSGATIRYEYSDRLLSQSAVQLAAAGGVRQALFVYAQKDTPYIRSDAVSNPTDPNAEPLFVATRLGRIVNVVLNASKYSFDIVVEGYPANDDASIEAILDSLRASGDVPWTKWVSTSDDTSTYHRLALGDDETKWSTIISKLTQPKLQFANDAFWRVKGPFTAAGNVLRARIQSVKQVDKARQIVSYYDVVEHSTLRVEVISESGSATETGGMLAPRSSFNLETSSSNEKAVTFLGAKSSPLRHYTSQQIEYRVEDAAVFGSLGTDVLLSTTPPSATWPSGPSIRLRHKIHRNKLRLALGVIAGVVGIVFIALAVRAKILNFAPLAPWGDIALMVVGALLLLLAGFWLSGKLELKAP
jgi:hypothetical protein